VAIELGLLLGGDEPSVELVEGLGVFMRKQRKTRYPSDKLEGVVICLCDRLALERSALLAGLDLVSLPEV